MRPALLLLVLTAACTPPQLAPTPPRCPEVATPPSAPPASTRIPAIAHDLPRAADFAPPPADMALPSSATSEPVRVVLSIEVAKGGRLSVAGKPTAMDDLVKVARDAKARDPSVRAIIKADSDVAWKTVIQVIDRLKQGGIASLAFGVQPLPP